MSWSRLLARLHQQISLSWMTKAILQQAENAPGLPGLLVWSRWLTQIQNMKVECSRLMWHQQTLTAQPLKTTDLQQLLAVVLKLHQTLWILILMRKTAWQECMAGAASHLVMKQQRPALQACLTAALHSRQQERNNNRAEGAWELLVARLSEQKGPRQQGMTVQARKQLAEVTVQQPGSWTTAEDPRSALIAHLQTAIWETVGQIMLLQHGLLGKQMHATSFLSFISAHCNRPSVSLLLKTYYYTHAARLNPAHKKQIADNSRAARRKSTIQQYDMYIKRLEVSFHVAYRCNAPIKHEVWMHTFHRLQCTHLNLNAPSILQRHIPGCQVMLVTFWHVMM